MNTCDRAREVEGVPTDEQPGLREVVIDGVVYEVLFDGAHHDCDADLFRQDLRNDDKRSVATRHRSTQTSRDIVEATLRRQAPLTMRQIAAIAGITLCRANDGLYDLRQQGRIQARDIALHSPTGRPQREYWLIEGDHA